MKKKILLLAGVLTALGLNLLAQKETVYIGSGYAATMIRTSDHYKANTVNDSYWNFDNGFKYGKVYLTNGDSLDNLGLRFNLSRDRFEAISDSVDGIYIINPSSVKYIKRMSDLFTFSKYKDKRGDLNKGYFKVVYDGDTKLYYRKAEIHKEGKHGAYGHTPYKTFDTNYYLKKKDEPYPVIIKLRKKHLLQTLGLKGPKLEVYAKEHHLHWSNDKDVKEILAYYDKFMEEM